MTNNDWDPDTYRTTFNFVTDYGDELIDLLNARPGERILDLGCGTGHHVATLTALGAQAIGVDASPSMVAMARDLHPADTFMLVDAVRDQPTLGLFDAVLSNAALHWMQPQSAALNFARRSLHTGGRFIAEMGGAGNVAIITDIFRQALDDHNLNHLVIEQNWFPTIGQQASALEVAGFEVSSMKLVDRPTPLPSGTTPADWCAHFRASTWGQIPPTLQEQVHASINTSAAHLLLNGGGWWVDYRRLRFIAHAV